MPENGYEEERRSIAKMANYGKRKYNSHAHTHTSVP